MDIVVKDLKKDFSKGFGKRIEVLKGINFTVPKGQITGFLGANGAGKTTTIKCLFNLIWPKSGSIDFFGRGAFSPEIAADVGFLPERPYFYEHLTGNEFLTFYGKLSKRVTSKDLPDRIKLMMQKVDLAHAADRPLRSYSKGMLQRVGIAQAILSRPKLVVLDEPMTGLDPDGRFKLSSIIREIANEGATVFFSSHLLHDVESLCKNLVILKNGEMAYSGSTDDFLNRLSTGFEVALQKNGESSAVIAPDLLSLQQKIKSSMSEGFHITSVRSLRPTLEEAFVKLSNKNGEAE